MTNLKKSRDEVGEMTIADAVDLFAYWKKYPPEPELLMAVYGPKDGGGSSDGKPKKENPGFSDVRATRGPNRPESTEAELRHFAELMNGRR